MAEGFANVYGNDVLVASSAGLAPTPAVVSETLETMMEKNIDISRQYPKQFTAAQANRYDLIVNMSGLPLPRNLVVPQRSWPVKDPYGASQEVYRRCSDDIENRVMHLILELRRQQKSGPPIAETKMKG